MYCCFSSLFLYLLSAFIYIRRKIRFRIFPTIHMSWSIYPHTLHPHILTPLQNPIYIITPKRGNCLAYPLHRTENTVASLLRHVLDLPASIKIIRWLLPGTGKRNCQTAPRPRCTRQSFGHPRLGTCLPWISALLFWILVKNPVTYRISTFYDLSLKSRITI